MPADEKDDPLDPTQMTLDDWLRAHPGTWTGTFTFNGVVYTDMREVTWRQANNDWPRPPGG